jgi:hypothetical protein
MDAVGFFSPGEVTDVRILPTDKAIARLPAPKDGCYLFEQLRPERRKDR